MLQSSRYLLWMWPDPWCEEAAFWPPFEQQAGDRTQSHLSLDSAWQVQMRFFLGHLKTKISMSFLITQLPLIKVFNLHYYINTQFMETKKLHHQKQRDTFNAIWYKEKKGEICLRRMKKDSTQNKSKRNMTTQKRHQNFDYTTIADRLRTVSWSNDSHQTCVVKPVYGIPTFPLTAKAV